MFWTVSLSIMRSFSLYTQQWYMSYRFCWQLASRIRMFHASPPLIGTEFRRGENILLISTESQYMFHRWAKFPIPLLLHFNLSPDQLATSVVACNTSDRCYCLPQYEVLDQHRRYRAGIITYWTWIVREYEVTCIPASQTIFSPNGYPACACLFTINITRKSHISL